MSTVQIVWFKRDLRLEDHAPLARAAAAGPVLPLYIVDRRWWSQPTMSGRQWAFVRESLMDLQRELEAAGVGLHILSGRPVEILDALRSRFGKVALWSHEETGDRIGYDRDRDVAAWARAQGVPWVELQGAGVQRRLQSRDGWAGAWDKAMAAAQTPMPALTAAAEAPVPELDDPTGPDPCPDRQCGGRGAGLALLASFLTERGQHYRREMSSPVTAFDACSRLSPHLAWGTLSTREVAQAAWEARARVRAEGRRDGWAGSLDSFIGRLHWRCHFMQKLEDEPEIETRAMHPLYDQVRAGAHDDARLTAWLAGETGYPMVDACMRALRATGYLNFRMRAMVTSFAAYHLWLDWRVFGKPLAALFTDYEAGIHYSQLQMQSGVTGINTTRVYNPLKQSQDQDPTGIFLRHWLPELAPLDDAAIHAPWSEAVDYPKPIVDQAKAARAAKEKIYAVRRSDAFQEAKSAVIKKHASRKGRTDRSRARKPSDPGQSSFQF
ncbi:MAG: FAD-binding domain-containing protein [Pseudomonadota bacterium]